MDRHPPRRRLFDASVGHEVLKLQGPPADEAESRAHRRRAVHVSFPEHAQGVGVIEGDASFVTVQAHSQPGWQRSGVDGSRVAAALGVQRGLAVAVCLALTVARSSGEQDLPHAHCQEAEGRGVLGFLRAAVMATVWVTPGGWGGI